MSRAPIARASGSPTMHRRTPLLLATAVVGLLMRQVHPLCDISFPDGEVLNPADFAARHDELMHQVRRFDLSHRSQCERSATFWHAHCA